MDISNFILSKWTRVVFYHDSGDISSCSWEAFLSCPGLYIDTAKELGATHWQFVK